MSIRQTINENRKLGVGVGVGVLVVALGILYLTTRGGRQSDQPEVNTDKGFFTTDDGKTLFVDDLTKVPPFDHDGKPAYRAIVFQTGGGQRYVGFLEMYEPAAKKHVEAELEKAKGDAPGRYLDLEHPSLKKPGGKWVKYRVGDTAEYDKVANDFTPPDNNMRGVKGPILPDKNDLKQ